MIANNYWAESGASADGEAGRLRPPPVSDLDVDVCIVGGGLTGLWTAYYLAKADPSLSIAILEKETVGFGASGRNGGWCSALFPRSAASLERAYGFDRAVAMRRAMVDTVTEVGRVSAAEGIDCDFARGGTITYAMNELQVESARADVDEAKHFGVDELEYWDFDPAHAHYAGRGHPVGARAAAFDPACARLHPAKLVHGLARVVESLGVRIYEHTEVTSWLPNFVNFRGHQVSPGFEAIAAPGVAATNQIVIATEAYGSQLPGVGRRILPLYSLMIATEPLSDDFWDSVGLEHGNTFSDYRHLLIYGQRTADNRFAFGGRGARYHWGSSIHPSYDQVERVFSHLSDTLTELFPDAAAAEVTHRWGGPIGVPRDWHASAGHNPKTGVSFAGGYVGDGLSTTNLAGRTLSDLITGRHTELTRLPWVNHLSPRWEPEPLRFIGANLGLTSASVADHEERMTGRSSLTARLLGPLTGH
ncbi:FAD-binding oxidoreductase [Subtercola sp. PAMC28395]|uniref:NAD(P)/FAD-dependent oxidoreductase n=1 Tax=Subtercola sp. PAMC28395 TaxID=2846775 RepID=UPI001C0AD634|nr:FAD-dependent oxidoreductase [Subtercola sp. PAMC28395]QWT23549.1 FAD-binding oxidoreductase [Subtercola sp. PAMC28395]